MKSWKPLYHFLFNTTVVNCYKLFTNSVPSYWPTHNAHKAFCKNFVNVLFKHSKCFIKPPGPFVTMEDKDIYKALVEKHRQKPVQLFPKKLSCATCIVAGKRGINEQAKRKPFLEFSVNTTQKPYSSKIGRASCRERV